MSRSKVFLIMLVVGLASVLITLTLALAHTGNTVTIRDSDPDDFSDKLSDMATIQFQLPALPANQVYEGWFVSDDASRVQSAGILNQDANGNINQTFMFTTDISSKDAPQSTVLIALNEQNISGQSGWAVLTAKGANTEVVLSISSGVMETKLVHIHTGTCGPNLGGVAHSLTSFVDGKGRSTTLLQGVSLDSLLTDGFAINSHNSTAPGTYTTCGNLPNKSDSITLALNEMNDSGQSGWATLSDRNGDTEVVLLISPGFKDTKLVHIHSGQCGPTLGGVAHGLTSFVGGSGASIKLLAGVSLDSLLTGGFAINSHNAQNPGDYTTCGNIPPKTTSGPSGENLFADFDKFVVSVEPVPDPDPKPSDDKPYLHQIPAGGILHIRHLAYSLGGNPAYTKGFHKGAPKGIVVGLREQTAVALLHANLSGESATLKLVQLHACHVVNIVEGEKGTNFDASCGNPGDGFGVLNYADAAVLHAGLATSSAADDPVIAKHHTEVVDSAKQTQALATVARDGALKSAASNDLFAAKLFIEAVRDQLMKALEGSDADGDGTIERTMAEGGAKQAYWAAQDMGQYVVTAAPKADDEVKPPPAGDTNVTNIALASLLVGVFLLLTGAYIYRRSRTRP